MHALTLHQPFATLIALEAKRVETRGWPAPAWLPGQRIAIHAGKGTDYLPLIHAEPFAAALAGLGLETGALLPMGAVVCTAVLDRCTMMTPAAIAVLEADNPVEHAFGHYEPGRFAWVLRDVQVFAEPIPARGYQKVWNWADGDEPQTRLV